LNDRIVNELVRIMGAVHKLADSVAPAPPATQLAIKGILMEIIEVYSDVVEHRMR